MAIKPYLEGRDQLFQLDAIRYAGADLDHVAVVYDSVRHGVTILQSHSHTMRTLQTEWWARSAWAICHPHAMKSSTC